MELVVSLDLPTMDENLLLVEKLREQSVWFKVGFRSYIRDGKTLLAKIKSIAPNAKLFLDLKLYDIPNTMADAAEEIAAIGVDMFNVHASSGEPAMHTVMERLSKLSNRPLVFAVTALTSFDEPTFKRIYEKGIEEKATEFATLAHQCGLDGVVCSVHESKQIKAHTSPHFLTLTPGIRPFGEDSNDQKRVATIDEARSQEVDFIVVGRPIYKSDDPEAVVRRILTSL